MSSPLPSSSGTPVPDSVPASPTADREIVLTRVYDAPRELVWEAWTNAEQLGKWWGPNGFTTTTHEMAVKSGGVWRFVMHGPDGTNYDNRIAYTEVVPLERLAYDHDSDKDNDPNGFKVVVTFEDLGGKTRATLRSIFPSAAAVQAVIRFGAIEGGKQTLAHLDEHLVAIGAAGATSAHEIVSTRQLAYSPAQVYAAFADPTVVARWWGPNGFTNTIDELDLRPGGKWRLTMHAPNGVRYDNVSEFSEVVPGERVVYRHLEPVHKFEMTMMFAARGGGTLMTWRMRFESSEEAGRIRTFIAMANQQNFDRLESALATLG